MIKVSPKAKRLLVPIVSVIAGFLVGAIIMLAMLIFNGFAISPPDPTISQNQTAL